MTFIQATRPTLSNIDIDIPVCSLVAIVGETGEGKTSLVSAMLGELPPLGDSRVVIRGSVAYVPQISWIFNATVCIENSYLLLNADHENIRLKSLWFWLIMLQLQVRENILFGSTFEPARYWKAVDVTALRHDLEMLPVKCLAIMFNYYWLLICLLFFLQHPW